MLVTILLIVIVLVAWSLHLMQQAVDRREFSLMLAGTLVAFSAAAMMAVYFLMGSYIGYLSGSPHYSFSDASAVAIDAWGFEAETSNDTVVSTILYTATNPTH